METSTSLAIKSAVADITGQEIERVMQYGDMAKMDEATRARFYLAICASVGFNPLTKPLILMKNKSGELIFYAGKGACEQLRKRDRVSVRIISRERDADNFTVIAAASTPDGRVEESMAVVAIKGLTGQALGDAMMKCESKSKIRATLSITGLGFSSVDDADPRATEVKFNPTTGEVVEPASALPPPPALPILLARQSPIGEAIDGLLAQGGVTHPADQEAQWHKWLAHYRDFTPAVLGLLRDKLQTRLRDKATAAMTIDAELFEDVEEAPDC